MDIYLKYERSGVLINNINYNIYNENNRRLNITVYRNSIINIFKYIKNKYNLSYLTIILSIMYFDIINHTQHNLKLDESKYIAIISLKLAMKLTEIKSHKNKNKDIYKLFEISKKYEDINFIALELKYIKLMNYTFIFPNIHIFSDFYIDLLEDITCMQQIDINNLLLFTMYHESIIIYFPSLISISCIFISYLLIDTINILKYITILLNINNYYTIDDIIYCAKIILYTYNTIEPTPYIKIQNINKVYKLIKSMNKYKMSYTRLIQLYIPDVNNIYIENKMNIIKLNKIKKYNNISIHLVDYISNKNIVMKCIRKKIYAKNNEISDEFIREVSILSLINKCNIYDGNNYFTLLYNIYIDPSYKKGYIYMEYIESTLTELIIQNTLSYNNKIKYIHHILSACKYLHNIKIIHRDIKPDNILVTKYNTIKLIDFNWSRPLLTDINKYTGGATTIYYRAPELYNMANNYNEKCDIWSCGCILVEMLSGNILFDDNSEISILNSIIDIYGSYFITSNIFNRKTISDKNQLINLSNHMNIIYNDNNKNLIIFSREMLEPNYKIRASANKCLKSQIFEQ
uniref:Protein kinase n=1 Tax=Pithovirus LCPAC102 TaxID=2506587 RepID=A0A481Z2Z1_9VIRU|nr:MAG: protein kinase [Pithovirus LCPAC102]